MSITFSMDESNVIALEETIKEYQEGAEEKINRYLHDTGYSKFEQSIINAMPESGRQWKGKRTAAKNSKSLQDKDKNENLAVTIRARTEYGYLYFPNDGTNTVRHQGNQQFFKKGVEEKQDEAVNDLIDALRFKEE